jgi:hypothetical protein
MALGRSKIETVKSYRLAPPRFTLGALWAATKYLLLPLVLILGTVDTALYFYFKEVLGQCYGIFCYF